MALITRVSRLFRADMHAVLDRIEEPGALLRQAVREMEEDVANDERRIRLLDHENTQLQSRGQEIEQSLDALEQELDVCFGSGKDDLARTLIRRKLEGQRFARFLSRKRAALEQNLEALRKRVEEHRRRLDSMRQKAELLAEDEASDQSQDTWNAPDFSVCDADVEVAFLREKQSRTPS